jgi:hypothetical protein
MMDTDVRSAAGASPPLHAVRVSAVAVTTVARESFVRIMFFLFHFIGVFGGGRSPVSY